MPLRLSCTVLALAALLSACGGGSGAAATPAPLAQMSAAARLGQRIFSDPSLSASGRQSCARCHDPAHAHAQSDGLAAQLGGADGRVVGFRAAPSLDYLATNVAFRFDREGTPVGGFDRDGRAATLAAQAKVPFLAPHEMANADPAAVIARLRQASYASEFAATFGAGILDDVDTAYERVAYALQQFQLEDPSFRRFDAKYDFFLAGKVTLNAQELRGLALFNDPNKGNCAACHPSARGADGSPPLFTDFSFDSLGVPRNAALPATANPDYYDLGLCGPDRHDLAARTDLCGAFKVPTLRNVATRRVFFHNGVFKDLTEVLRFYVTRDTDPGRWYPRRADGSVDKFNDLPAAYRANVNTSEAPYNRRPGMAPALSEAEIADVVAFLGTLTDGYTPSSN